MEIKISNTEQLIIIKETFEKINNIAIALDYQVKENKIRTEDFDIINSIIVFFVNWTKNFKENKVDTLNVEDFFKISSYEQTIIKEALFYYESEVNSLDKNYILNQSISFKEALESFGINTKKLILV